MNTPDLTPERVAELEAIAEKATQKAWFWREEREPLHMRTLAPGILVLDNDFGCGGPWGDEVDKANAAHIATFDPPTVLALLAEVERLTKERDYHEAENRNAQAYWRIETNHAEHAEAERDAALSRVQGLEAALRNQVRYCANLKARTDITRLAFREALAEMEVEAKAALQTQEGGE